MPTVDFCFLTYNRFKDTLRCFHSLAFTLGEPGVRWLVWDNASRETAQTNFLLKLAERYNNVEVFLSAKNEGVTGGRIQLFQRTTAEIVASLDSDVIIQDRKFLDQIRGYPWVQDGLGIIGAGGHFLNRGWQPLPARHDYEGPVHVLAGYSHIFPRKLLENVDFDIKMNFHGAEDDWFCLTAQEQGYFVRQVPLPILHRYGNTWDGSGYQKNRQYLYDKHHDKYEFEPVETDDPRLSFTRPLVRMQA